LQLISLLSSESLAAVRQDEWLVQAGPPEYPQTRRWATWLRAQDKAAAGITWPSRRNLGHQVVVLFGDRSAGALQVVEGSSIELDSLSGARWINETLAGHRVGVKPPRERPVPPTDKASRRVPVPLLGQCP
jgi:hypothetical protein